MVNEAIYYAEYGSGDVRGDASLSVVYAHHFMSATVVPRNGSP